MYTCLQPFCNERPEGAEINTLVLHCSAHGVTDMIEALEDNHVSAHYIVAQNGEIVPLIPEEKRAWHAGISYWRGINNVNDCSIGIELCSPSMGQEAYPDVQLSALAKLCQDIISRHQIPACNVVGHSDIAPERKPDPGVIFPWKEFAQQGIGLWYDVRDAAHVVENDVCALLKQIGYNVENPAAAAYAFCRHFVPEAVEKDEDIRHLIHHPYPEDFKPDDRYLNILKACAFIFNC